MALVYICQTCYRVVSIQSSSRFAFLTLLGQTQGGTQTPLKCVSEWPWGLILFESSGVFNSIKPGRYFCNMPVGIFWVSLSSEGDEVKNGAAEHKSNLERKSKDNLLEARAKMDTWNLHCDNTVPAGNILTKKSSEHSLAQPQNAWVHLYDQF
ncbi:hypothetical protein K438DRAFT_1783077 [Mycena galopus ATCC 62051]|nr:hypothetical protein K438DRAFT_1783077 [Mycena galopus ATCC 62051]